MLTEIYTEEKERLSETDGDEFLEDWNSYSGARHLTDAEAIVSYRKERTARPDSLVVMEDLDCGHWGISVYTTEEEKEEFIRSKWSDVLGQFKSYLKRINLSEVLK